MNHNDVTKPFDPSAAADLSAPASGPPARKCPVCKADVSGPPHRIYCSRGCTTLAADRRRRGRAVSGPKGSPDPSTEAALPRCGVCRRNRVRPPRRFFCSDACCNLTQKRRERGQEVAGPKTQGVRRPASLASDPLSGIRGILSKALAAERQRFVNELTAWLEQFKKAE